MSTPVPAAPTDQDETNPRWIDWHFPDVRLINATGYRRRLRANSLRSARGEPKRPLSRFDRWCNLWMLNRVHCEHDGECVLRAGHRGSCDWGYDGEDD